MALDKTEKRLKIKRRVRKNIHGTAERPRLSVYKSNKEIYAQLIDDINGVTMASASSREGEIASQNGSKSEISTLVGKKLAEKALASGIETVVFDRNGFVYHGRIAALAGGAREGGLKF